MTTRATLILLLPAIAGMAMIALAVVSPIATPRSGDAMARAAKRFLEGLTPAERERARLPFDSDNRYDWHYVPRQRQGLSLREMTPDSRKRAEGLLRAGLSEAGALKASTIMSLETILREIEGGGGPTRDAVLYSFTVFGDPEPDRPWGWRVEGHHLSLNFTLVDGSLIASAPRFFGANPAEVKEGPRKGLRVLPGEEDIARDLLRGLEGEARRKAVLSETAPADILTGAARRVEVETPKGLAFREMTPDQRDTLRRLVEEYIRVMPEEMAAARRKRLEAAGWDDVRFAWAGGAEKGQPHYYRVQGPIFLIEYDNTQDNANHIHSVWRDYDGDWGEDLLRDHYENGHHR